MLGTALTINEIRDEIKQLIGERISLEAHKSKKKLYQKEGKLCEAYSNIFIVEIYETDGGISRLSFSYTDLLTKNVKLSLLDAD